MKSKMFDKKFWEISRAMDKKHPRIFKSLEEYDKTHKLAKWNYKKRIDFTIDSQVLNKFKDYCKTRNFKMSNVIENLIKKEIK